MTFQYSVQAIWTAAQHRLPIVYVVMRNNEYSILKSFAVLEETPGVPAVWDADAVRDEVRTVVIGRLGDKRRFAADLTA